MNKEIYGWKNKETYRTVLHLQTDYYRTVQGMKKRSKTWIELSDNLKDLFSNLKDSVLRNPNQDGLAILLDIGSLEEVDFDQIAQSFLEVEV